MGTRTTSRRGVRTAGANTLATVPNVLTEANSIDKSLQDADWSFRMADAIYAGEDVITEAAATDEDMQYAFQKLGLDPQNAEHVIIMAGIMGAFGDREADVIVRTSQNSKAADNFLAFIVGTTTADSERTITIKDNEIVVKNMQFSKNFDGERLKGMGYAMLVRQITALRQLSRMMGGKPVRVVTEALSDDETWNGASTWPRMGYDFDVRQNSALSAAVKAFGFTSAHTTDLMTERNAAGELGFDRWNDIVKEAMKTSDVRITGSMTVTDDKDVGLQTLIRYGQNKGIIKSGADRPAGLMDMTEEDVARLRQAWLGE